MSSTSCSIKGKQKIFQLHNNQAGSCCRAYPESLDKFNSIEQLNQYWDWERSQLDQGVRLTGCESCWQDQDRGIASFRKTAEMPFETIEIFYSNLCNQMCSYCSPKYSSAWQDSIDKNGTFFGISKQAKHNQIFLNQATDVDHWVDQISQYIQSRPEGSIAIKILGGEPLMQIKSLEKLLTFNQYRLARLMINTNLNPPTNKFLHWLLERFSTQIEFHVSLDSSPDYNHIPRGLFDSEKFLENLDLLKQHQSKILYLSLLTSASVLNLPSFLIWLDDQQADQKFLQLNNPECLHPKYLPKYIKQIVLNQIQNHPRVPSWILDMLQYEDPLVDLRQKEAYNYYNQYFIRTGIDPNAVTHELFVQYWNFLKEHSK